MDYGPTTTLWIRSTLKKVWVKFQWHLPLISLKGVVADFPDDTSLHLVKFSPTLSSIFLSEASFRHEMNYNDR